MKKKKLTLKQKRTIERAKETRQIDSNKLRGLIKLKKEWTLKEIKRGIAEQQKIQITLYKLEGIAAFIQDLLEPQIEEK